MYSKIPAEVKPTPTSAKLAYTSAFDSDFCLLLRERRCATLAEMQDAVLEVESNIMAAKKLKSHADRRRQRGKASSSTASSSDTKLDKMTRMIESLSAKISKLEVEQNSGKTRLPGTFAPRNPNPFTRTNEQLQIIQRGKETNEDQRVKAPFQNVVMEEEQIEDKDEIHCMEDKGSDTFLTLAAYEESLLPEQDSQRWDREVVLQIGEKKRYNLRSNANNVKENPTQEAAIQTETQNSRQRRSAADPVTLKAPVQEVKGFDKLPLSFSFESEVQRLKIPVPLIELVKSERFRKPILEALELKSTQASTDFVNLQDDRPAVVLSPMTEPTNNNSPYFYVSLTIHDKILHNCLLDTGASHNLMPKTIMEELGLDITRSYHDLFSFDSRKVKCLGLIKDLAITLTQLPMKSIMMDIVVVDVPPKFGMLLSRGWIKRLGGTLQNDLSYATVPVFGGESRRLYREA